MWETGFLLNCGSCLISFLKFSERKTTVMLCLVFLHFSYLISVPVQILFALVFFTFQWQRKEDYTLWINLIFITKTFTFLNFLPFSCLLAMCLLRQVSESFSVVLPSHNNPWPCFILTHHWNFFIIISYAF